jgi:RNA polymerase sigma-70 factor (ECF subfamily)
LTDSEHESEIPIGLLRGRDPGAFTRLVKTHEAAIARLCQSLGLRGADIDDASAEVFAEVYRSLGNFEARSSIKTWVYRIAYRTIPKVRAKLRGRAREPMPEQLPASSEQSPADQSETAELHQRLWEAVAKLDEREASAIQLHYREQLPIEQIAEVLRCPVGTVKTLLFRGRARLRGMLPV